jgi:hypothetical protein
MSYVMVDVESDGPIPGDYSMVCFGAVLVRPGLEPSFYARLSSHLRAVDPRGAQGERFLSRGDLVLRRSRRRLIYKGLIKSTFKNFKHLRKTAHSHDPVDDARGNAEALLHMKEAMGLEIALE